MEKLPKLYATLQKRFGPMMERLEELGEATAKAGPLDSKTGHLIQLAGAAALRSEGAVRSHVRRAKGGGASSDEIRHALVLLVPTIGFPTVAAALSWIEDLLED